MTLTVPRAIMPVLTVQVMVVVFTMVIGKLPKLPQYICAPGGSPCL